MATDIRAYFEIRTPDGWGWEPLWKPTLIRAHGIEDEWYFDILDRHLASGAGSLLCFSDNEAECTAALEAYYASLSDDEIYEKFGDDPYLNESWRYEGDTNFRIRDYSWFVMLGLQGFSPTVDPIWEPIGLPIDISLSLGREAKRQEGDAHSMSWLMVCDILKQRINKPQVNWLRENIPDPSNTRMVYWFSC
jgi:hypothetical protein